MTYGKRTCLVCGSGFEAGYPAQVTCSKECKTKRRAGQKFRCQARRLAAKYSDLDWLNGRLECALAEARLLDADNIRLHRRMMEIDDQDRKRTDSAVMEAPVKAVPQKTAAKKAAPQKAKEGSSSGTVQKTARYSKPAQTGLRKCHDCGKPTTDYRCQACRVRWQRKNGIIQQAAAEYASLAEGMQEY